MNNRVYHISDVLNEEYLRFPLTLLAEPKYREISLEAKMIYSLLLNRLTLSQRNGWINENGEVYLIYTREDAAETLNITYKKTIAAFKELIAAELLFEQRQGRGYPNLLYVMKMVINDEKAEEFSSGFNGKNEEKEPENPDEQQICQNGTSRHAETAYQELPKQHIKTCQNDTSRTDDSEYQDMSKSHPRKNNNINLDKENLKTEKESVCLLNAREEDEAKLSCVFEKCDLSIFSEELAEFFKNILTRMFFAEYVQVDKSRMPQTYVRNLLYRLTTDNLLDVAARMKNNESRVTKPIGFVCSLIINVLTEETGGLVVDLPPNYVDADMLYG